MSKLEKYIRQMINSSIFPLGACTHRPFSCGCIGTHGTREVGAYGENLKHDRSHS